MSAAIQTQGLTRRFRLTAALQGIDLEVPAGAIYALAGPPRAGKSTCLKVLMNILSPSAGRAEVLGVDSRRLAPAHFSQIGYLSSAQEMPSWMTVGHYLKFLRGFYPAWDAAIEAGLMRRFQLPLDRRLRDLSIGTRRKAALVSSLAYRPKLVVLDEPFRGLEALARKELIEGLLGHTEEATLLIATADLAQVERFASHIGWLEAGRLRFSGELAGLRARFREIVLTFPEAPALPGEWPARWIQAERSAAAIRFVDTQFDPERTPAEARRLFPEFQDLAVKAVPLRSIVAALAQDGWPPA